MVKQFLKKKSKRQPARQRYKIEKKIRDHKKKVRKQEKKNGSKKRRKDPGIPNSLPFKESVLREAEERKMKAEQEQQKRKEKRKKEREKLLKKKRNLEGVVKDAQKRTIEFEKKRNISEAERQASGKAVENSLKTFYKEFKKVVDAADVVLEVLDARDPLGSRCPQMEETIISSGANKRLVLVLNKIDLVPKENVEAWLKHLRNEFPTVSFKASTQTQADNLSQTKMSLATAHSDLMKSSHCIGADLLMKLLGNYCRNRDIKSSIRVGVVGFPNTGKSSIINSLKRSRACNVGAMPGITRNMQEVQLDKHITLLDSPGVVMAKGGSDTSIILRNCVKLQSLDDPLKPVEAILKRCPKQQIMLHYKLSDYSNVNEFLALLARRHGKLKKGGIPDIGKAAKAVLQDWTNGRITYYTEPPEQHTLPSHISAEFVAKVGKEFNIEDVQALEQNALKGLASQSSKYMLVESIGTATIVMEEGDLENVEEEEMVEESDDEENDENVESMEEEHEDEELKQTKISLTSKVENKSTDDRKALKHKVPKAIAKRTTDIIQLNKARKDDFKKMKKRRRRADKVAGNLSEALTGALNF